MNEFRYNADGHRFEYDAPEGLSYADYRDVAGVRVIMHVETPATAQGLGHATKLMNEVVALARNSHIKLRASCSFAVAYLRRHPEAGDVLA